MNGQQVIDFQDTTVFCKEQAAVRIIAGRAEDKGAERQERTVVQQELVCIQCICYHVMLVTWVSSLSPSSNFFKLFQVSKYTLVWRLDWRCTIGDAQASGCREERKVPVHRPLEALWTQSHLA